GAWNIEAGKAFFSAQAIAGGVGLLLIIVSAVVLQSCEHDAGAALICCESAKITAAFVQMAPLRTCGDHLCGGMVSAVFALLSQRRRTSQRARATSRPYP